MNSTTQNHLPIEAALLVLPVAARPRYRRCRHRASERGASLIEIMVVLVILLIGVFLAIRIFPSGFATLRANENRTIATQLAQRMLSVAKGDASESLPQGILAAYRDPTTGKLIVDTSQDPESLGEYTPGSTNPYFDDVNKFHYVKGEQVKIPLPTRTLDGQNGSVYSAKFGPIYVDKESKVGFRENAPTTKSEVDFYASYLAVAGSPLTPLRSNVNGTTSPNDNSSDAYVSLRGSQTYVIDYGGDDASSDPALLLFTVRPPAGRSLPFRTFFVSYSYVEGGEVRSVSDDPLQVDDSTTPAWIILKDGATVVGDVIPGTVTITRAFDRIKYSEAWDTSDPYQYKLASDNVTGSGGTGNTYANIGAVMFNPAGANYSEATPYGQRAFTAFLDYAVLDWHIIRDDIEVPSITLQSGGYIPITTTLHPLKQAGDSQTDLSIYNNLYHDDNPAISDDIAVYDFSEPELGALAVGSYRASNPNAFDILVDYNPRSSSYRTGTIYVNTSGPHQVKRGSQLRVLYQADGDWGVSLQKSYALYRNPLFRNPGGLLVPRSRPKANVFDQFGVEGLGSTARVYFPGCDLNKSVTLSIEYQKGDTLEWKRLDPIQVTPNQIVTEIDPDDNAKKVKYCFAEINPAVTGSSYIPTPQQADFNSARQWRVGGANGVGIAYGTSVKSRVIWHDVDTSAQRWRVQDLDSNLSPSP